MFGRRSFITTIGSAVCDILFYTDEGRIIPNATDISCPKLIAFEHATKIRSERVFQTLGGSAANTASTFARMGLAPAIITALGRDALGEEFMAHFGALGIDARSVQRYSLCGTGISFVVSVGKKNDHVIFLHRGACDQLELDERTVARIKTPWVYVTSLSRSWRTALKRLAAQARTRGQKLVWNPGMPEIAGGASQLRAVTPAVHLLLVNQDEAVEIAKSMGVRAAANPRALVRRLHTMGSRLTVVTAGHKGSYLFDGKKTFFQPARRVRVMSKTGAGDAYGSGFVSGLILYKDVRRAMKIGAYNSASVVATIGAQAGILSRADTVKL